MSVSKIIAEWRLNLLAKGYVPSTIRKLRQFCPFSQVGQRPVMLEPPKLKDVHSHVQMYQRGPDFFTSEYMLKQLNRADYRGAPPQLRLFVWKYLRALRARGLPFYVHTCYRSPEEQLKLYNQGNSQLTEGAHQRSCAVDIVSSIDHWQVPKELWQYVGTLGQSVADGLFLGNGLDGKPLKIEWGGAWQDFYDPAHWQLHDWRLRRSTKQDEALQLNPFSDKMRFG